ncbi:unnamed protein product [Leptidea sinapis]|uniref:Uncharacterized protein n=1 Tax=Leptidea sinapis TaxID=189913 RepID=A0A5E4QWP1_9NEOP|nr:unnamed protein product [Leptidea sinapis]
MEQLTGAYIQKCTDLTMWDTRYNYNVSTPEWRYPMPREEYWFETDGSYVSSSDSGRYSSPCCSEVIFNGGQHFSGKGPGYFCKRLCYPGNFGFIIISVRLLNSRTCDLRFTLALPRSFNSEGPTLILDAAEAPPPEVFGFWVNGLSLCLG